MNKNEYMMKKPKKHYIGEKVYKFSDDDMDFIQKLREYDWANEEQKADKLYFIRHLDRQRAFVKGAFGALVVIKLFEYWVG